MKANKVIRFAGVLSEQTGEPDKGWNKMNLERIFCRPEDLEMGSLLLNKRVTLINYSKEGLGAVQSESTHSLNKLFQCFL